MDKIEKLLRKIKPKDRAKLLEIMELLANSETKNFDVKKIKSTDFYRLKSGRFRMIFHYDNREIVIDSIKLRNENTYKNF